jgi:hypothetical protein
MGAQHDFGYRIQKKDLVNPLTDDEVFNLMSGKNDFSENGHFADSESLTVESDDTEIYITYSFYSSHEHLSFVQNRVKEICKKILRPGSDIQAYYEIIETEDQSFSV